MLQINSDDILAYFSFATARLCLQPVDDSALSLLISLYGCNKTMQYIAEPFTSLQTTNMLNQILNKQSKQQCNSLILRVKHKTSLDDYGISGIPNIDFVNKQAEVGVMLLPKAQGQGVAVEIIKAIVAKLNILGIKHIYMNINPLNKAAIIGANKVGFIASDLPNRFVYG